MTSKDDGETQKKTGLESLSHDELVVKCKNLLSIAQRAKRARDDALEENNRYRQELENIKSKESDMESQMENMTKTVSSLTDQKMKLLKQVDEVGALIGNLKQNLWEVRQELVSFKESNERLENELQNQMDRYNLLENQLKKESAIREQLESDKVNLNDDLGKLTENTEQMKVICKQISEERVCLEKELAELKAELTSVSIEKSDWNTYLSSKFPGEEFSSVKSWIKFFNQYTQNINETSNKIVVENASKEESSLYENSIEKLNLLLKELCTEKELLNNEIVELKTKNSRLLENLEELNLSRDTLLKKLDEVRIETQTLIENSEILSEENSLLKSDKNKLDEELNNLLIEKTKLVDKNKEINFENETINNKIQILQSDLEKINVEYEMMSAEKNNLVKTLNDSKRTYSELVEEHIELKKKYDDAHKCNVKLNERIQEFENLNSENDNKFKLYINEINEKKKILEKLEEENDSLKNNLSTVEDDLREMSLAKENYIENQKEKLSSDLSVMKKELINLIEFIISKSNQNVKSKIPEHVEDENSEILAVFKSLKGSVNQLVEENILFKNNINEFNFNINNMNLKILENEKIIDNLKMEKQQIKDLLEEKVSENNNMIKSLESLKLELENISHHMKISEKEKIDENNKDIVIIKVENEKLRNELKILITEKEKINENLRTLEKENKNISLEKEKLSNKNEELSKEVSNLNEKMLGIEEKLSNELQTMSFEKDKLYSRLEELIIETEDLLSEKQKLLDENKGLSKRLIDMEENFKTYIDNANVLNSCCDELKNTNKKILKELQSSINCYIKSLSLDKEIIDDSKDEHTFLIEFRNILELIKDKFIKKEAEIESLRLSIKEKEESIILIGKENKKTVDEFNLFKDTLGAIDEILIKSDARIEEIEASLRRIADYNLIINELCDSYSNCFNVDKTEAIKCVKEKLNFLKSNKWIANNAGTSTSVKILENDQSWEVIQSKDREKMEESQEDIADEIKSVDYDVVRKKDKEISDLQDKVKELKMVAVKLKKKVTDQNQLLENERQKYETDKHKLLNLTAAAKNAQTLQQECDRLTDELEETKKKMKNIRKSCDLLEETETKLQQRVDELESQLESKDKDVIKMKTQLETCQTSLHNVQKELNEKQTEKTAQDVIVKELERELLSVQEKLKTMKLNFEQVKQESRKQSVLSLEMQDYERSVNDLTTQISQEKDLVKQLEEELDAKTAIQNSLQEQIDLLEKRVSSEEERANVFNEQLIQTRENLEKAEKMSLNKAKQISDLMRQLETEKSNKDILALQLSDLTAENQKQIENTRQQNEALLNRVAKFESDLRCSEMKRVHVEEEMTRINKEFEAYKVRAQSVLRQRGGSAAEREAKEECMRMQELHNQTKSKLHLTMSELERVKSELSLVITEKETLEKKCDNLNNILMQRNKELDRQINEHRSHKISTDTLIQCYKSQLEEKERGYQMELDSLREQMNKLLIKNESLNSNNNDMDLSLKDSSAIELELNRSESNDNSNTLPPRPPLIEREDGEGSEGNESSNYSVDHSRPGLISLDKLLNSPGLPDDDKESLFSSEKYDNLRGEIAASNTRVRHLIALLSESEKDSARKEEQIAVLKEEIRRLQRCIERQPHAHNTEYLKNVVFKFVTLHSGDERSRLVPVLDTILKLSPDELRQLAAVAKGETEQSSTWGLYLPSWPSLQS